MHESTRKTNEWKKREKESKKKRNEYGKRLQRRRDDDDDDGIFNGFNAFRFKCFLLLNSQSHRIEVLIRCWANAISFYHVKSLSCGITHIHKHWESNKIYKVNTFLFVKANWNSVVQSNESTSIKRNLFVSNAYDSWEKVKCWSDSNRHISFETCFFFFQHRLLSISEIHIHV